MDIELMFHTLRRLSLLILDRSLCRLSGPLIFDSVDGLQVLQTVRPVREWLVLFLVEDGSPILLIGGSGIAGTRVAATLEVTPLMFDCVMVALSI